MSERMDLERFPIAVAAVLADENLFIHDVKATDFDSRYNGIDLATDRTIRELRAMLLGKKHPNRSERYVPLTWWDHFKRDVMPEWSRRWFPVKFERIVTDETRVCPHINVKYPENSRIHIDFLRGIDNTEGPR
jgi:hypothetical protein